MGWIINTYGMPSVPDHDTAAKLWADAKPWRNEHHSWRELDGRRATHKRIVKLSEDRGYELVLFSTSLVTYYANGDLALCVHDSPSSNAFAWRACPDFLSVTSHNSSMYWCVPTAQGKLWVRPERGALKLKFITAGVYEITSPVQQNTEWKLDLKKAAATRKKLSHYDRWQKITARLTGAKLFYRHAERQALRRVLEEPTNVELYAALTPHPGWGNCPPLVSDLLRDAYELEGARYKVPVPMGQLPKRQK